MIAGKRLCSEKTIWVFLLETGFRSVAMDMLEKLKSARHSNNKIG